MAHLVTINRTRSLYAWLRSVEPFNRWGLPEADAVRFYPMHDGTDFGEYDLRASGEHVIGLNAARLTTLDLYVRTLAHEMVHMRQQLIGRRPATKADQHNREFYRLAGLVCRSLGFDPEHF